VPRLFLRRLAPRLGVLAFARARVRRCRLENSDDRLHYTSQERAKKLFSEKFFVIEAELAGHLRATFSVKPAGASPRNTPWIRTAFISPV